MSSTYAIQLLVVTGIYILVGAVLVGASTVISLLMQILHEVRELRRERMAPQRENIK